MNRLTERIWIEVGTVCTVRYVIRREKISHVELSHPIIIFGFDVIWNPNGIRDVAELADADPDVWLQFMLVESRGVDGCGWRSWAGM